MVEDKKELYLKQLKDIERKDKFRKARKEYKKVKYFPRTFVTDTKYFQGKKFLKKEKNPVKIAALAYRLMEEGIGRRDFQYSLLGAQLYEKIGRGKKAISRLLGAVEKGIGTGKIRAVSYTHLTLPTTPYV